MGSLLRQGTLAKDGIGSGGFLSLSFEEVQNELACGSGKFLGSMNMVRACCGAPVHLVHTGAGQEYASASVLGCGLDVDAVLAEASCC